MDEKTETKQDVKRIVRLMSTDIDGNLSVERALRKIKGVSFMFSRAVCTSTGIDKKRKVGTLADNERKNLENFITSPSLPAWMMNMRKDPETGKDTHLTMAELSKEEGRQKYHEENALLQGRPPRARPAGPRPAHAQYVQDPEERRRVEEEGRSSCEAEGCRKEIE